MHFLFVKNTLSFPRASGHDVHSYHMMRTLAALGHEVSLLTEVAPTAEALQGLPLSHVETWDSSSDSADVLLSGLKERFRNYWGIENSAIESVAQTAALIGADVVVAVGLEVLPLLAGVKDATRIWYAADEWVWHHLSVVRLGDRSTWGHVRNAMIKGLYEFAYRDVVDRAWVVSKADQRAMRLFAGIKHVDIVPNGVDTDHFSPVSTEAIENSCVFWGRLDFEPNIQALQWFCAHVWPRLKEHTPNAQFRIFGFCPTDEVRRLALVDGISLHENLPDLRTEIARSQVVVLPFISGGGIKNKLLEAASMAKPIVCSQRACNGLRLPTQPVFLRANRATDWVDAIVRLWASETQRTQLGQAARHWVETAHSWESSAHAALHPLKQFVPASVTA